jgi:hypothetical protein
VLEIEAANQVAIGLDPVGVVDVGVTEETQQVRLAGLDDVLQSVRRKGDVADKIDRLDAGLGTFDDLENQVDAVVRLLDDLRGDVHVVAAGMAIDLGDALGVRLHHRARQGSTRLGLDFSGKLLVLDLLVALEGDTVDHGVFHHGDQEVATGVTDVHVLEQAGFDQRFQALVD